MRVDGYEVYPTRVTQEKINSDFTRGVVCVYATVLDDFMNYVETFAGHFMTITETGLDRLDDMLVYIGDTHITCGINDIQLIYKDSLEMMHKEEKMAVNKRMYGSHTTETVVADGKIQKKCIFCGEFKPLTEFAKNGVDKEGNPKLRDDCKTCYNIRRKSNRTKKRHSDFIGGQKRRGEEAPNYSHQEWKEALIFFGGTCAYCGCTPRKGKRLTRDHLEPVSSGGHTIQSNIIPACASCNSSKGAEDFKVWFMKQPFFSQDRLNQIFKWRTIIRQTEGGGEK